MNKVVRYIVTDEKGEQYPACYNAALGREALNYATQNASRYHTRIFVENSDGQIVLYKSYEKK